MLQHITYSSTHLKKDFKGLKVEILSDCKKSNGLKLTTAVICEGAHLTPFRATFQSYDTQKKDCFLFYFEMYLFLVFHCLYCHYLSKCRLVLEWCEELMLDL